MASGLITANISRRDRGSAMAATDKGCDEIEFEVQYEKCEDQNVDKDEMKRI